MSNLTKDLKDILSNNGNSDELGELGELGELDKSLDTKESKSNDKIEGVVEEVNDIDNIDESIELSNDLIDSLMDDVVLQGKEQDQEQEQDKEEPKKVKKLPSLFDKEWIKLEKGMKLNRINLFIKKQKGENGLNDTQTKSLKDILFKACNDGMLNKMSDVTYKDEEIQSIRNLEFNEQTKKYKLKTSSSKHRVNVKSRSNIDRFMKK